jgi:hypothetical protein
MNYLAILITGDIENSLGGACSRDVWNISKKLLNDLPIEPSNIFAFFHDPNNDIYVEKVKSIGLFLTASKHISSSGALTSLRSNSFF